MTPERKADAEIATPPCQEILDAQGFLVLADLKPLEPGTVIPGARGGFGYSDVPGPLVVIGSATFEEWAEQVEKYFGGRRPDFAFCLHFYKVTAE